MILLGDPAGHTDHLDAIRDLFAPQWRIILVRRLCADGVDEDGAGPDWAGAATDFVASRVSTTPGRGVVLVGVGAGAAIAATVAASIPQVILALIVDAGDVVAAPVPTLAAPWDDAEAVAFLGREVPEFAVARPYCAPDQRAKVDLDPFAGWRPTLQSRAVTARTFTPPEIPDGIRVRVENFGGVECRVLADKSLPVGAVLFVIHGGGFTRGEARFEDPRNLTFIEDYTRRWGGGLGGGFMTITPEYRLAPEYPYPAGLADTLAALRAVFDRYAGLPLIIVGDSAGSGMANQVLWSLRSDELALISGVIAFEPCLDPAVDTTSTYDYATGPIWPRPTAIASWGEYCDSGARPWQVHPPIGRVDPAFPPVFVTVNTADVLRDEAIAWTMRLIRGGAIAELHCFPGTVHGWSSVPGTSTWDRVTDALLPFVDRCLRGRDAWIAPADAE